MAKHKIKVQIGMVCGLALFCSSSFATSVSGIHFIYKDWELACDNTGTCRAAGYQSDADFERPISVLLERAAGANTPVVGWVKVDAEDFPAQQNQLAMSMLGPSDGMVAINKRNGEGKLSDVQTQALLKALQSTQSIRWKVAEREWVLSSAGANAVFLKLDDFQKRTGTPSAWINKGNQSNAKVLRSQPLGSVNTRDYQRGVAQRMRIDDTQAQQLILKLKKTASSEQCSILYDANYLPEDQVTIYPLNRQNVVVEAPCWRGAYNVGYGYWVMDKALKQTKQFVTASASSFSEGQIFAVQKGRGLGDCMTYDEWAWNGKRFVKTYQAIQAQCKGFAGGAWPMPLLIYQVGLAQ